jgi:hypothetical protein
MKFPKTSSETKYQALAKQRQAAALRWRNRDRAEHALQVAGERLMRWRKVERKSADRAIGWAYIAIRTHAKG